ncbi:3-hydroxyisobutyrate dehydrogenase [Iodidimonas muriae]|uniref:3-hydroxyisobutyrate dehydrogenase n=1 Tax=Iodidimonas muriae TaxID=261467 RepID=A0ABQ2LC86_9PROT|nr:NAD(P)-dependent oxidoreductase [Iodidimonas muriae]GER06763.1 3-hydroxyisobutyrate dehydrogenase [Kordiimonadales bacterium JCM 17843]GGO10075.1 3-hydroxyisobutyrate dehydrogenase [Iodidimonas muriae]
MSGQEKTSLKIGWIGTGRMGFAMARRLIHAGYDVSVYNRTRAKAEPLGKLGATLVDNPRDLASCDITFSMVSGPADLKQVISGDQGVLSDKTQTPSIHVDCSSVSAEGSADVRKDLADRGAQMIAAPVSGNAKVVEAGMLSIVASGPEQAFQTVHPLLDCLGEGVSYVGDGELARMVKICHNIFLGVVTQSLAEITILAEKGGVKRHAFLDFINKSVMGSVFTRYKTPAFVNLDWKPTFTPALLKKDLDLGLSAGRTFGVPQPLTALTREIVQSMIGNGYQDIDFGALLELQAKASGLQLTSENIPVTDGLTKKN